MRLGRWENGGYKGGKIGGIFDFEAKIISIVILRRYLEWRFRFQWQQTREIPKIATIGGILRWYFEVVF